jgi:hypothetical protein
MSKPTKKVMDPRCLQGLEEHPETFCPLAVLRLKAIRNAGKELSEEEEAALPGCPWAVNHQLANYCFFKYITEYVDDKTPSDTEIASLNNISVDTVKKTEKSALTKIRATAEVKALKDLHGGDPIMEDGADEDGYKVHR